jgi:hypothetical protein
VCCLALPMRRADHIQALAGGLSHGAPVIQADVTDLACCAGPHNPPVLRTGTSAER